MMKVRMETHLKAVCLDRTCRAEFYPPRVLLQAHKHMSESRHAVRVDMEYEDAEA